jgi:hypothetical protein
MLSEFDSIAHIRKILKIDAFDRAAIFDIKAWYDAFCKHRGDQLID